MAAYYRCSHCRGFYETELPSCKFCNYKTVVKTSDNRPKVFPDRETCRAIQIAEYEQLPLEAMKDPMRPDKDELAEICGCLHCGPGGPPFEAVEMRWMVNENLWACPCTTCGGRGYHFDIHPTTPRWECAHCRHKWAPPGGNAKPSNCKCPNCGSTEASGWFQDEYTEEEIEAMTDEEFKAYFGKIREEEQREFEEFNARFEKEQEAKRLARERGEPVEEEEIPFDDIPYELPEESSGEDFTKYDPEARTGEDTAEHGPPHEPKIPDDIDFPRTFPSRDVEGPPLSEDDIPW